MTGGSGAECSDAVLYSCPAVHRTTSVDASQVVLVQSALMQYCTPAQQRNHFCGCHVHGSGAEYSDASYIDLLIREMQLPVISCWLLSYYQLLSRMEIFAALR